MQWRNTVLLAMAAQVRHRTVGTEASRGPSCVVVVDDLRLRIVSEDEAACSSDPVARLAGLTLAWFSQVAATRASLFYCAASRMHGVDPLVVVRWPGGPDISAVRTMHAGWVRTQQRRSRVDALFLPASASTVTTAKTGRLECSGFLAAMLAAHRLVAQAAIPLREHGRITGGMLFAGVSRHALDASEVGAMRAGQPLFEHAYGCARAGRQRLPREQVLRHAGLTPREHDVVEHVVAGATTVEIARTMSIAPATVKTHLVNVYKKLEVGSRVELISALLSPPSTRRGAVANGVANGPAGQVPTQLSA